MSYIVKIWSNDTLKKELVFEADNDIQAIQMASAATPDNCRSTYEIINKEDIPCQWEKEPTDQKKVDQAEV